jgi:preprotein translocase subunit SecD
MDGEEEEMKLNKSLALFGVIVVISAFLLTLPVNSTFILLPAALLSLFVLIPRDMLKTPRIFIWIFFIIISLLLIGVNMSAHGYAIDSISKNSTITNLVPGEVIYKINDADVTRGFESQPYFGTIKFDTDKGTKFATVNGSLGIEVSEAPSSRLKFGLDLKGGVRAVISPNQSDNATIEQVISTLQTRINIYGLRESVFRPVYYENKGYVEISIAGGTKEELRSLLENQGKFVARITFTAKANNGSGAIKLDKTYPFTSKDDSIFIDGKTIREGETAAIAGIPIKLENSSIDKINLTATVIEGSDVRTVYYDPQRSRVEIQQDNSYRWSFAIQLSQDAANKFAWVTSNLDVVPGQARLSANINFFLDENPMDSLSIASNLKGRAETEISITGSSAKMDQAIKDRAKLQSILRSGALPTDVSIVQLETISPSLGIGFLNNAILAGLVALIGVVIVVTVRYRKPKIVVPMIAISSSEVLIILGVASLIGWTIDLPAIAGIIASIGTGIDSQIMIIDQALRGEDRTMTLKEKMKRAFFVIFGAGGTVIAAMIPLMRIVKE